MDYHWCIKDLGVMLFNFMDYRLGTKDLGVMLFHFMDYRLCYGLFCVCNVQFYGLSLMY